MARDWETVFRQPPIWSRRNMPFCTADGGVHDPGDLRTCGDLRNCRPTPNLTLGAIDAVVGRHQEQGCYLGPGLEQGPTLLLVAGHDVDATGAELTGTGRLDVTDDCAHRHASVEQRLHHLAPLLAACSEHGDGLLRCTGHVHIPREAWSLLHQVGAQDRAPRGSADCATKDMVRMDQAIRDRRGRWRGSACRSRPTRGRAIAVGRASPRARRCRTG